MPFIHYLVTGITQVVDQTAVPVIRHMAIIVDLGEQETQHLPGRGEGSQGSVFRGRVQC